MQVTCESCGKELRLPPEKVPDRPFTLACPQCRNKIRVDPTAPGGTDGGDAPQPTPAAAGTSGTSFEPLRPLLAAESELLEAFPPLAFLVAEPGGQGDALAEVLAKVGCQEVQRFPDVAAAVDGMAETEVGLLMIEMSKAPPPPCPPLEPLRQLSPAVRRRTFVALAAQNVRSLDGQVAFYLEVNCVLSLQELPKLPTQLRRALLHDLRLYRHWGATVN